MIWLSINHDAWSCLLLLSPAPISQIVLSANESRWSPKSTALSDSADLIHPPSFSEIRVIQERPFVRVSIFLKRIGWSVLKRGRSRRRVHCSG